MLIPLGTDRRLRRQPIVNPLLVIINVVITLWVYTQFGLNKFGGFNVEPIARFMLRPTDPAWYQFVSYQFLHADGMHLIGNMIFLWAFGNAVEDRLGRVGYAVFYLAGGAMAAGGSLVFSPGGPTLGASGSIAAVAGAFLALAPLSQVRMTMIFIHYFELPSIWLIGIYFAWDVLGELTGASNVAYMAHISGYIAGFAVGLGLLKLRILEREMYDFLALMDRWNRRRQFRAATRDGDSPWSGGPVKRGDTKLTERDAALIESREAVARAIESQDIARAIDLYEKLLGEHPRAAMPRDVQFDLANYAMQRERHAIAASAYEVFCEAYTQDPRVPEARLVLGLIHTRYTNQPDAARPHLTFAVERLDGDRKALAEALLGEIDIRREPE